MNDTNTLSWSMRLMIDEMIQLPCYKIWCTMFIHLNDYVFFFVFLWSFLVFPWSIHTFQFTKVWENFIKHGLLNIWGVTTPKHLCLIDFCWQNFVFVDVARTTFLSQHTLHSNQIMVKSQLIVVVLANILQIYSKF